MSMRAFRWVPAFLVLTLHLGVTPSFGQQPPSDPAQFHIYVLAGQSNMAGRGVVEAEDRVVHPRVWMLNQDLQWVPAVEPMHFDKPIAGVGPGRSFGIAMAEAEPGVHIGLVPAAVGGSPVTAWVPGALYAETGAHPYDEAIDRATAAMEVGELKGILWHQGESDSNPRAAAEYERNLSELIARFRQQLENPDLPFIIGQLGRFEGYTWSESREQVDAAQRRIASQVPNVGYVSAEGLGDKGDGVHFNAPAFRELGRRYAAAYQSLVAQVRGSE